MTQSPLATERTADGEKIGDNFRGRQVCFRYIKRSWIQVGNKDWFCLCTPEGFGPRQNRYSCVFRVVKVKSYQIRPLTESVFLHFSQLFPFQDHTEKEVKKMKRPNGKTTQCFVPGMMVAGHVPVPQLHGGIAVATCRNTIRLMRRRARRGRNENASFVGFSRNDESYKDNYSNTVHPMRLSGQLLYQGTY